MELMTGTAAWGRWCVAGRSCYKYVHECPLMEGNILQWEEAVVVRPVARRPSILRPH